MRLPVLLALSVLPWSCSFTPDAATDPALREEIAQAEARVRQSPDDTAALIELGERLARAGRHFEAADRFKEASDKAPGDARAMVGLADAYSKLGYFMEGWHILQRCVALPSGNAECLLRLGLMARADGSKEALLEARRLLDRFLNVAPSHPRANDVRLVLQQLAVQIGPEAQGEAPAGDQPASQPAHAAQGTAPGAEPSPAIPAHQNVQGNEQVGELNPFGRAFGQALEAIKKNDPAAAEVALKQALSIQPNDIGANALLAETYFHQGKVDLAVSTAEKAYQLDSNDPEARFVLGMVLIQSGRDPARGVEAWRALQRDQPQLAEQLGVNKMLESAAKLGGLPKK